MSLGLRTHYTKTANRDGLFRKSLLIAYILVYSLIGVPEANAIQADTVLTKFSVKGNFVEAKAIAASPMGTVYVVDEGASRIYVLDEDGIQIQQHGGPGSSEGQFDEPADIDPTNGLIMVVADAGNGRIQRFSREFLFLEALELGDYSDTNARSFPDQPRYRQNDQISGSDLGRPVAVITASNNEMYAIDAAKQVVLKWDRDRNITQVIGDYDQGPGALSEPIALEAGADGSLFVLDQALGAVLVYDAFGGYLYTMGNGGLKEAVALERSNNHILVAFPDKLHIYQERGLYEAEIKWEIEEPVVDILLSKSKLYLLGRSKVFIHIGDMPFLLKPGDS